MTRAIRSLSLLLAKMLQPGSCRCIRARAHAVLAGLAFAIGLAGCDNEPAAQNASPPLVVLIVIDQLRGDEIVRYEPLWRYGMKRLLQEGRWYRRAHVGHARTETAAGHATIATGVYPKLHGVSHKYLPNARGDLVQIAESSDDPCDSGVLKSPSLGDRLKSVSPHSRVVAVAMKDRAARLLGGSRSDVALWIENDPFALQGCLRTEDSVATRIRDAFARITDRDSSMQRWEAPVFPREVEVSQDDDDDEIDRGIGTVFPHLIEWNEEQDAPGWGWFFTPDVDRAIRILSLEAARALELGSDDIPDLLQVSFSANDYIGHTFGPDSVERVATLIGVDHQIGTLMQNLEELTGGNLLIALTSDHGVAPTVAQARRQGELSDRISREDLESLLEAELERRFGSGDYVLSLWPPYVTLNERQDVSIDELARVAARVLRRHHAIYGAWPTASLPRQRDPVAKLLDRGSHPERSGQVAFAFEPYHSHLRTKEGLRGAQHGSPWLYDQHVPIILWGPNVAPGSIEIPVEIIDLTRTLADQLGLPADARGGRPLP